MFFMYIFRIIIMVWCLFTIIIKKQLIPPRKKRIIVLDVGIGKEKEECNYNWC